MNKQSRINEWSEWATTTTKTTKTLAFGQFSDAAKAGHWTLQPAFDKFEPSVSGNSTGTFLNNLMDMNMVGSVQVQLG